MELDKDGQPAGAVNRLRNLTKATQTLLGICQGLIADNILSPEEIIFLDTWLAENREVAKVWPGDVIARRIRGILADGVITLDEAEDLKVTLSQITGGFLEHGAVSGTATSLPVENVHSILFEQSVFCLTGKFIYGSRSFCQQATEALGGQCVSDVTHGVHYLVVGGLASRDWAHTSYGRKIEKAVMFREKGQPIRIISEENWAQFV
ncbi:MAG: BRCT domain-containing protein [Porticoccaceae bacterium]|nr:BRCT domain-containing protein [Porticoccaceae bacterium]